MGRLGSREKGRKESGNNSVKGSREMEGGAEKWRVELGDSESSGRLFSFVSDKNDQDERENLMMQREGVND